MKIFITGGTGYIGQRLIEKLSSMNTEIHVLVRNIPKAKKLLPFKHITFYEGNVLDILSIEKAITGCNQVYHLAALASVYHKNKNAFEQINVEGFKNVLEACLKNQITQVLFTSTAGVVGHSIKNIEVTEYSNERPDFETQYEKSKLKAESIIKYYLSKGLEIKIVNPTRVYGPGLLTESNGFTRIMNFYIQGKWKVIPGNGESMGNYVFIDDVVNGIVVAMDKAKSGERYLLGGENISYNQFFKLVKFYSEKNFTLFHIPINILLIFAFFALFRAKLFGKHPIITPAFVKKYRKNWTVNSSKAQLELGYTITPFREGLKNTIHWLKANHQKNVY